MFPACDCTQCVSECVAFSLGWQTGSLLSCPFQNMRYANDLGGEGGKQCTRAERTITIVPHGHQRNGNSSNHSADLIRKLTHELLGMSWLIPPTMAHRHPKCSTCLTHKHTHPVANSMYCVPRPESASFCKQLVSMHRRLASEGFRENTKTWKFSTAPGKAYRRLSAPRLTLEDWGKAYNLNIVFPLLGNSCEIRIPQKNSEKTSDWPVRLTKMYCSPNTSPQSVEDLTTSLNAKKAMQDFSKHEKIRKHNPTKGIQ